MSPSRKQARTGIETLIERYGNIDLTDRKDISETQVVSQFINPFFEALGWPVHEPKMFRYEQYTYGGRPDIMLIPERGGIVYVEAKRFGGIRELRVAQRLGTGIITPGQLALPGMATDRTAEEQQAINYAFENDGTWAILTNFEKLRLFNARRDWLVLSFEKPGAYLDEFDTLWQLSYESILSGELDRLSDQRHREDVDTTYLSFISEYRELLAKDIVAHAEANPWVYLDGEDRVNLPLLRDVVQRFLDRLVVVRFAEDHFVLPPGTLRTQFEVNRYNDYGFPLNAVVRQFFHRFDELHNSALFAHDPVLDGQASFSEDVLAGLIDKLYEARYRAMTPDIMGNTYEQYLGQTLVQVNGGVQTRDNLETRKKQGSYYTPQVIVRYLVDNSLGRHLYGTANGQPDGEPVEGERRKTYEEIRDLRVLDPACGSGSFLIYAYKVLADFYRSEIERIEHEATAYGEERMTSGEVTLLEIEGAINAYLNAHKPHIENYPRLILERHLYGVDLDPQAAELAAVNLIFRAMEDQRRMRSKEKLPLILNQNVKTGNALVGVLHNLPEGVDWESLQPALAELRELRQQLVDNSHDEETLARLVHLTGLADAVLNRYLDEFFEDVEARRPFNWFVEFPEVFIDEKGEWLGDAAGFDVIVGNPPWEIVKPDIREYYAQFDADIESRMNRQQVERRIKELNRLDPKIEAGWEEQKAYIEENASYLKKSSDFVQQGRGDTALHKLFLERTYELLSHQGRLSVVVPAGLYKDLGTKELREMLLDYGRIEYMLNFSNERFFFPGVHHAFHFTLLGAQKGLKSDSFRAVFRINPRVAVAPKDLPGFLADEANLIHLRADQLARFSPSSLSIMEFNSQHEVRIVETIYNSWPLLGDEAADWKVQFWREFDMTNDRDLFREAGVGLPLFEGKTIHQFDCYYSAPRYSVIEKQGRERSLRGEEDSGQTLSYQGYRLAYRDVASNTNERTLIAAVLPADVFAGNTLILEVCTAERGMLYLAGLFNSFVLDFIIRYKVRYHVSMFYMYQLPLPRLEPGNPYFDAIVPRAALLTCTTADFAELWEEVVGEPWTEHSGATEPEERQRLRDEIDALVAHLYGLSREDFEHILGTFPLVFPDDEQGQARKEALLGVYDMVGEWGLGI